MPQLIACALATALFLLPCATSASTLNAHSVVIDDAIAADFSFTKPFVAVRANVLNEESADGAELTGFNHRCDDDNCPIGSSLRIDGGATIFMDIGSTQGGNEYGSFKRVVPGSNPTTGATGGFMTLAGLAASPTITTDTFYLRLWTDGDDYLLNNVWMNGDLLLDGKQTNAGFDSTFLGTANVSAIPLPFGLPMLASAVFGLGVLRRCKDLV